MDEKLSWMRRAEDAWGVDAFFIEFILRSTQLFFFFYVQPTQKSWG
jgi:hypothetical protein